MEDSLKFDNILFELLPLQSGLISKYLVKEIIVSSNLSLCNVLQSRCVALELQIRRPFSVRVIDFSSKLSELNHKVGTNVEHLIVHYFF